VLHKCDNRACANPDHLFIGTQADNMRDAAVKGRIVVTPQPGERNPMARLTAAQVLAMRGEHAATREPFSRLAQRYGVTTMTAWRAVRGHCWGHIA
jgi:hypothetical protein